MLNGSKAGRPYPTVGGMENPGPTVKGRGVPMVSLVTARYRHCLLTLSADASGPRDVLTALPYHTTIHPSCQWKVAGIKDGSKAAY